MSTWCCQTVASPARIGGEQGREDSANCSCFVQSAGVLCGRSIPPWSPMVISACMDQLQLVYITAIVIFSVLGSMVARNRATNLHHFCVRWVHSSSSFSSFPYFSVLRDSSDILSNFNLDPQLDIYIPSLQGSNALRILTNVEIRSIVHQ